MQDLSAPLPSPMLLLKGLVLSHMFNEYGFYFTHRLLHHPAFYARFHKQHHEYKGTVGIAAEYANPVEVLLSNIIPSIGGAILFGGHPLVVIVWLGLRLQQTYETHSGYYFRYTLLDYLGLSHAVGSAHHDWHHADNRGCYGSELLDWVFGTMDSYVEKGGYHRYDEMLKTSGTLQINKKDK